MFISPDTHSIKTSDKYVALLKLSIIFTILASVCLLSGCATISRNIFAPAADASRVPPLIRSAECSGFVYDGEWGNPKAWRNPFWRNPCEIQNLSLPKPKTICPYVPEKRLTENQNQDAGVNAETGSEMETNTKDTANTSEKNDNQKELRQCAASYEIASDKICTVHLSKIFGNRAVTNATLGIVASGAGIAGGLVSGTAANALSGSSGFLTADRSILNEEIYRNYVAEAIIKEIIDNRKTLKANILTDIVKGDKSASGILGEQEVLQRVLEYHDACSFYAGLTSLIGKAGVSGQSTSDVKKNLDNQIVTLKDKIKEITAQIDKEKDSATLADLKKTRKTYQDQLMAYQTARNSISGGPTSEMISDSNDPKDPKAQKPKSGN